VLGSLFGGWLAVKLMNLTRLGKSRFSILLSFLGGYTGCFLIGAKLFKKSINNWPQEMRDRLKAMIENIFKEKKRFDFKFKSLKNVKKQMEDSISKNFHNLEKFSKNTFPS